MLSQPEVDEHEIASGVVESLAETGDRERLAGGSAHENVNCAWLNGPLLVLRHVPEVRDVGKTVLEHFRGERLDLAERDRRPAEVVPRDRCGFDAAAHGQVAHHLTRMGMTTAHDVSMPSDRR